MKKRILIVDDNNMIADLAELILQTEGHSCTKVKTVVSNVWTSFGKATGTTATMTSSFWISLCRNSPD